MQFGLPVDTSLLLDGDGHVDFVSATKKKKEEITIDVKTARKAYNLLVKEWEIDKVADILVLASFDDSKKEARLLGWYYGHMMKFCPKKVFKRVPEKGFEISNHYKKANFLDSIDSLKELLGVNLTPLQPIGIPRMLVQKMKSRDYSGQPLESGIRFVKGKK